MSDDTTTTDAPETEVPDIQPEAATVTDWEAEAEKWKALSRKNEAQAKENAAKAKKLDEIELANKTELERVQAALEAAEKRAAETESTALRAQVALAKGLTPTQAKRLVGSTLEELEADADELLADLKAHAPKPAPSSDGQGKQGEPVGQAKQITSRDQLKSMTPEQVVAARKEGRLDGLLSGKS